MNEKKTTIQMHISPDLEYCYRDLFNIYASSSEVIIEFGNHHRSTPEHATVTNRIVLSVQNAYNFINQMHQTLQSAEEKFHQQNKS
ncbi:MAG: DUF3467 domain-containing protein [Gammaproteobacteria bacterium]|nr:DUF3467 domain-containing protein [Gammaproteobacteria bacterium]